MIKIYRKKQIRIIFFLAKISFTAKKHLKCSFLILASLSEENEFRYKEIFNSFNSCLRYNKVFKKLSEMSLFFPPLFLTCTTG